jgi:Peptidase A4 family
MQTFRAFLARWSAIAALAIGVCASGTAAIVASAEAAAGLSLGPITTANGAAWVGYTFDVPGVTGVRADWTEPLVLPTEPRASEFVWVGIGGWYSRSIMQVGTAVYVPGVDDEYENLWYERFPLDKTAVGVDLEVFAGNVIQTTLTLLPGTGGSWRMLVKTSTGAVWTRTVTYSSPVSGPDFVVEDPRRPGGDFAPFPRWGSVAFSHMSVRVDGRWVPAGHFAGIRLEMVRDGGTLATASALTGGSSFTAVQTGCSRRAVLC